MGLCAFEGLIKRFNRKNLLYHLLQVIYLDYVIFSLIKIQRLFGLVIVKKNRGVLLILESDMRSERWGKGQLKGSFIMVINYRIL